jgi:uncharacterized damage-inducible protein DinB
MTKTMISRVTLLTLPVGILALSRPVLASGQSTSMSPQTMVSTILPWWEMIEKSFVSVADAMPEEKWAFAPKDGAFDGVRTFAQQVKHVACANFAFFQEIEKKTPPDGCETGGPDPSRTKADLLKYLRDSFAYGHKVIEMMTPENALDAASGRYGGNSTRLGLTTLAVWHASDHYGQIVVYLRMNGIVPPPSR